jgi:hypothetical protein
MFTKLRGLLDRNVLTALAIGLIVAFILISFIAALTGHYDRRASARGSTTSSGSPRCSAAAPPSRAA